MYVIVTLSDILLLNIETYGALLLNILKLLVPITRFMELAILFSRYPS
jgi:hypothetical protein